MAYVAAVVGEGGYEDSLSDSDDVEDGARNVAALTSALSGRWGWCGFLLTEQSGVFYNTPHDCEMILPEGQISTPATAIVLGTVSTFPVAQRLSV